MSDSTKPSGGVAADRADGVRALSPGGDGLAVGEVGAEVRAALTELLRLMGFEAEVAAHDDGERVRIDVTGPDTGLILGKKGATLEALQLVVNKLVNRRGQRRRRVVIDAEHYRDRRSQALATMARQLGLKAVSFRRPLAIIGMAPADRRVVHLALASFAGVRTHSEGQGSLRRMMVVPQLEPDGTEGSSSGQERAAEPDGVRGTGLVEANRGTGG